MITHKQLKLLTFIRDEIERTGGVAPTVRECADYMGYAAPSGAYRALGLLEEKGFITRARGARNLVIHRMPLDPLEELRHFARRVEREYGNARQLLERVAGELG